MSRKRLTQILPFLLPLRLKQKKLFFYLKMEMDNNRYANTMNPKELPYPVYYASFPMINEKSGYDIAYQHNKVFNLKLAAKTMNGILIHPGETFSFWQLARYAEKEISYKDGLCLVDGKIVGTAGGGLCQLSDLLFWMFLHTPLDITERHAHTVKNFPTPDVPAGSDATIREGWLDLKVTNRTGVVYQVNLDFKDDDMTGRITADQKPYCRYETEARNFGYIRKNGALYERACIYRIGIDKGTNETRSEDLLFEDCCRIGYELPTEMPILDM